MVFTSLSLTPVVSDTSGGGAKQRDGSDDWKSYAIAASIALQNGFREASKRMVKQAKEKLAGVPPGVYKVVAFNICDMIVAADRRRMERAAILKRTAIDGMRSISGSESVELRDVLEQVCSHLENKS